MDGGHGCDRGRAGTPLAPAGWMGLGAGVARLGAEGDAISLGCEDFVQSLPDIESYIGRRIPVQSVTQELLAEITLDPVTKVMESRSRPGHEDAAAMSEDTVRRYASAALGLTVHT